MTENIPTIYDYDNFSSQLYKLRNPPDLLTLGLYDLANTNRNRYRFSDLLNIGINTIEDRIESAEKLKKHKIYKWISKRSGYRKAFNTFRKTKPFRAFKQGNTELLGELEFIDNSSLFMISYLNSKDLPLKVVTPKMRKDTLKPIKSLREKLKGGVELITYTDTLRLESMLDELEYLIKNDVPTLVPRKNLGHLRERWFAQHIAVNFKKIYGEYLPTVISHLLEAIDVNNISQSVLDDWIKGAKEYYEFYKRRSLAKALREYSYKTTNN